MTRICILVDPPYKAYYGDAFFDNGNPILNRDGSLEANARLREKLANEGKEIHTADFFQQGANEKTASLSYKYYSFGMLGNFEKWADLQNVSLEAFLIMEPPVVAPQLYRALPKLTKYFKRVYVHNTHGDGYSLKGVDVSKLHKLCYPMPYPDVIEPLWERLNRLQRIVVINSNHNPLLFSLRGMSFKALGKELYSKRIEAMCSLEKQGIVDLYGRRWQEWWLPFSMWPPYWKNRRTLMDIYRGSCKSKYEVLSQYKFSLCFENMTMEGYVTEKIIDCFYAGTIPLYLGAKNIQSLIPGDAYIDCSQFESWEKLWDAVNKLSDDEIVAMKSAGRHFLKSPAGLHYYNFLEEAII